MAIKINILKTKTNQTRKKLYLHTLLTWSRTCFEATENKYSHSLLCVWSHIGTHAILTHTGLLSSGHQFQKARGSPKYETSLDQKNYITKLGYHTTIIEHYRRFTPLHNLNNIIRDSSTGTIRCKLQFNSQRRFMPKT